MALLWRIHELQLVTEQALALAMPETELSGRVRAVPDSRTIRYYTTLGLIAGPAEMRGRTAFYGRLHVLQLVCIKRLQANGLPLERIQQQLAGATTRKLTELAALPAGFFEQVQIAVPAATVTAKASPAETVARAAFWAAPAQVANELPLPTNSFPIPYVRLPVAPGVSLEFSNPDSQQLTPEVLAKLQPALAHLSQEMRRWGILPREPLAASVVSSSESNSSPSAAQEPPHDHDSNS